MNNQAKPKMALHVSVFGRLKGVLCSVTFATVLAGCTVGPNFVRPAPPTMIGYTPLPYPHILQSSTGEPAQNIEIGKRISGQWWQLFESPALNTVVQNTIRENRTLQSARHTLAAAEEDVVAVEGNLYPQLLASADADRTKSPGSSHVSNLYSVGATVSYAMDFFGGTRRAIEQQRALAQYQHYQLAAVFLSLTGNAVDQAITIASLRAQIEAFRGVIAGDRQTLALARQAFQDGKVARTDVLTAETQLANDQTALPELRQQLSVARNALATLTGHSPATSKEPDFNLSAFNLPRTLPLSLPSRVVRQRPDILAAEARLHADSAAIGIATAELYPNITLTASLGQQSLSTSTLFNATNAFWTISGQILAPLFEGGTLRAQRRAALETYKASLSTYEQTVLDGFQQVADTLRALQHDADLVGAEHLLLKTARESLRLQKISYVAGRTNILNLIDAERTYQRARISLAQGQAQRLTDSAQLFLALGGGWWHHHLQ